MAGSWKQRTVVLLAVLAVPLALPPAAGASSIVFSRPDGNVWLINPDGSGLYQVTLDGSAANPYESPSQSDGGLIAAARGTGPNAQIIVMAQNGAVLAAFRPQVELAFGLLNPKISPDGSEVAYATGFFGNSTCDNGSTGTKACITTHVTSTSGADDGVTLVGDDFPSWASADRLLVAEGDRINTFDFGDLGSALWFGNDGTFRSEPELAATGTRVTYTRSVGSLDNQLAVQATTGDPRVDGPPAGALGSGCAAINPAGGADGRFISPTWSPDGTGLAWEESDGDPSTPAGVNEGVYVANVGTDVSAFCTASFPNHLLIAGGSDPDWGPANINPGPRPGPACCAPPPGPICCSPPPADRTAPVFQGAIALGASTFAAAGSGGSIARRAPIGTKVTYRLSEAATVTFTVERPTAGRKVGRRCVAPNRSNRRKPRCTRYVAVRGSFTHRGRAGSNSFKFTGRVGGRKLSPGSYQLVAVAKDAAGNRSAQKRANFRIVRR